MQFAGQERRRSARTVANVPGTATFTNGRQVACTVVDQSETGAKLAFASIGLLPERFELAFGLRKARSVSVVWRRGSEVGVAFV
ncbi:PilZ domain-containing protein [Methylobacterium segetis]|uniref:PilZ domain-containing protein n=1 Tax=Methylobacterium segetis TaxID=2488750 RepID=UPI003CCABDEC